MKKTIFVLLLIGVTMAAFAQTAVIRDLTGTVELKPSGAAAFTPAAVGAEVAQNTVVSTGFKSSALLQIGSATIAVRPLTRLTLTEIQASQGTENLNVSLQSGRVRVDLNPPAGSRASLGVSSPSATASVRGTSFEFDTRNVWVHEGTVAFTGNWGYQVLVQEGSSSGIGSSGTAGAAQRTGNSGSVSSGYDQTSTPTGGTGVATSGGEPEPEPEPEPQPQPTTGDVGIGITY